MLVPKLPKLNRHRNKSGLQYLNKNLCLQNKTLPQQSSKDAWVTTLSVPLSLSCDQVRCNNHWHSWQCKQTLNQPHRTLWPPIQSMFLSNQRSLKAMENCTLHANSSCKNLRRDNTFQRNTRQNVHRVRSRPNNTFDRNYLTARDNIKIMDLGWACWEKQPLSKSAKFFSVKNLPIINRFLTTLTGSLLSRTGPPILTSSLLSRTGSSMLRFFLDRIQNLYFPSHSIRYGVQQSRRVSPGFITWLQFCLFFIFAEEAQYNLVRNVQN